MKKLIIIMFTIFACSLSVLGQRYDYDVRDKFKFGIKGGANYSNVYDTQGEDFVAKSKFGWVGGIFFDIPFGSFVGIQPEVLFSQKGFDGSGVLLGTPYQFTRTTDFIDVPLFVAIKPIEAITILVGPQFSYLLKRTDVFENSIHRSMHEQEFANDNIRKNILSLAGGLDFNLAHLTLGTRVGWDLATNNGDGTSTTPRYKNIWLQATLGLRFYQE
jgi:hypothetical protein